jgi:arsenate reductase (thioredoxin)
MTAHRTVLFVCVGNAGRSMMAEAIFNKFGPKGWRAVSAGVFPARTTNPNTGPTLSEIGVPLPPHPPQGLTEQMVRTATVRVSIGALDHPSCPEWFTQTHPRRWELPDTHHTDAQGFREIREAIRSKVDALTAELRENEPQG